MRCDSIDYNICRALASFQLHKNYSFRLKTNVWFVQNVLFYARLQLKIFHVGEIFLSVLGILFPIYCRLSTHERLFTYETSLAQWTVIRI